MQLNVYPVFLCLIEKSIEHRVPANTEITLIGFQYKGLRRDCFVGLELPECCLLIGEALFYLLNVLWVTEQRGVDLMNLVCQ